MNVIICKCQICSINAIALNVDELRATFTPTPNTPFNPNKKADRHAIVFYANSTLVNHRIVADKFGMKKA